MNGITFGYIPEIEELKQRIATLEQLCAGVNETNDKLDFNGFAIRYIVVSADEKRVLTQKGFKTAKGMKDNTYKLFISASIAREYLENHYVYKKIKVKIKRVKITYEFLNDVIAHKGDDDYE